MGALESRSEHQSQGPRASLAAEQAMGLSSWAAATPAWPGVPHRWAPQIVRMAGDRRAPRVSERWLTQQLRRTRQAPVLSWVLEAEAGEAQVLSSSKGPTLASGMPTHAAIITAHFYSVRTVQELCPLCLLTLNSDQPIISSAPLAVESFIPVSLGSTPVVLTCGESLNIC